MRSSKIVVNLAPAEIKKEGPYFDLPIAIGILISTEAIKQQGLEDTIFIGELSLDGKLMKVNGIEIIGVNNLTEIVDFLNGEIVINEEKIDAEEILNKNNKYALDFSDVKGQENVKRALEISAAGGHNVLLIRLSSVLAKQC